MASSTTRRASSAVFTRGSCTPLAPKSRAFWMWSYSFMVHRTTAGTPRSWEARTMSARVLCSITPCSLSSSRKSKPIRAVTSAMSGRP